MSRQLRLKIADCLYIGLILGAIMFSTCSLTSFPVLYPVNRRADIRFFCSSQSKLQYRQQKATVSHGAPVYLAVYAMHQTRLPGDMIGNGLGLFRNVLVINYTHFDADESAVSAFTVMVVSFATEHTANFGGKLRRQYDHRIYGTYVTYMRLAISY